MEFKADAIDEVAKLAVRPLNFWKTGSKPSSPTCHIFHPPNNYGNGATSHCSALGDGCRRPSSSTVSNIGYWANTNTHTFTPSR